MKYVFFYSYSSEDLDKGRVIFPLNDRNSSVNFSVPGVFLKGRVLTID